MIAIANNYHALTKETFNELDYYEAIHWQWKERRNVTVNYDQDSDNMKYYDVKPANFQWSNQDIVFLNFSHKEAKRKE